MRLNKINVEFKIYWTAALQWDNILLTEKRERKKEIKKTTVDHQLHRLENYIIHNMHWIYLCSEGWVTYECENSHSSLFQNSKIFQVLHSVRKWELNLYLNAGYFTSWLTDYRKIYKIYILEVIYVYPHILTNCNIQQVQTIQTGATISTEPEISLLPRSSLWKTMRKDHAVFKSVENSSTSEWLDFNHHRNNDAVAWFS